MAMSEGKVDANVFGPSFEVGIEAVATAIVQLYDDSAYASFRLGRRPRQRTPYLLIGRLPIVNIQSHFTQNRH
jgi:hypothetical protein